MKKEDLFLAFGKIDDDLIENSEKTNNKFIDFPLYEIKKYMAIACCFILIIVGGITLPNMLTIKSPPEISNTEFQIRHNFNGTITDIKNDNGAVSAYIKPNNEEEIAKHNKLVVVHLSEPIEFTVGEVVIVHYSEIKDIDEYINLLSFIIEKQ